MIANTFVAFQLLVQRGKIELAYPSALAWFAVRQVREGRRVGGRLNVRDVLSGYAQRRKGLTVQSLSRPARGGRWEDLLVEDRRSTPADVAACRIDFQNWLKRLDRRRRALALRLAGGESTTDAAHHFRLSLARISQVRQELRTSWRTFQGEPLAAA